MSEPIRFNQDCGRQGSRHALMVRLAALRRPLCRPQHLVTAAPGQVQICLAQDWAVPSAPWSRQPHIPAGPSDAYWTATFTVWLAGTTCPLAKTNSKTLASFPVENRSTASLNTTHLRCAYACIIAYSWVLHFRTNLAGPLVMLFFLGHLVTGAFSSPQHVLVVDINKESPATAVAANKSLSLPDGRRRFCDCQPAHRPDWGSAGPAAVIACLWAGLQPGLSGSSSGMGSGGAVEEGVKRTQRG